MARDHSPPGASMASRLSSRLERSALSRTSVAGGGEVFQGPVATRALNALGARAMTLDRSIVVSDDFDPSKPEDRALYAHEAYHAEHGDGHGGGGGENYRDAEEIAARAAEAIAFREAKAGGYEGGNMPGAGPGQATPHGGGDDAGNAVSPGPSPGNAKPDAVKGEPKPERGYQALLSQGMTHFDVVDDLARKVVATIDDAAQVKDDRQGDLKGTI